MDGGNTQAARIERIDAVYLIRARSTNPGASEEVIREAARRLMEASRENAREWARRRYPNLKYREF